MASELPETIVLVVATNLGTRFVVIPSRTETIASIRATMKDYHLSLFPRFGEVDVAALEIELPGGKSRLADPIKVGQLFPSAAQASLFAELTVKKITSVPRERQIFARSTVSDGQILASSPKKGRQAAGRGTAQARRQDFTLALKKLPDSSKRTAMEALLDDDGSESRSKPRQDSEVRKKKNGDKGTSSLSHDISTAGAAQPPATETGDMKEMQAKALGTALQPPSGIMEVNESHVRAKDSAAKNLLMATPDQKSGESDGSELRVDSDSPSAVSDGAQSAPHPKAKRSQHGGAIASRSKPLEKDLGTKIFPTQAPVESARKEELQNRSRSGGDAGLTSELALSQKPGVVVSTGPSELDSVVRRLLDIEPRHQGDSAGLKGRGEVGNSSTQEVSKVSNKAPVAPASKEAILKPSMFGTPSRQLDRKVRSGGVKDASPSHSKQDGIADNGPATSALAAPNGASSHVAVQETARDVIPANKDGKFSSKNVSLSASTTGSDSEEGSEDSKSPDTVQRKELKMDATVEVKVKQESSSTSESESSEESDSESQEISSQETDEAEHLHPIASQTANDGGKMDSVEFKSRNGRRGLGGPLNSKYQHLLDSQDGFDELVNLSQQKVLPDQDKDINSLDNLAEGEKVGFDKPSDLPVEAENVIGVSERGQRDPSEANAKGDSVEERTVPSLPILKDKLTPPQRLSEEEVAETLESQSRAPRLEEAAEQAVQGPAVDKESPAEKIPEPGRESSQKVSEDFLQMKAAEQLARMSEPNVAINESEMGLTVKRKRLRKASRVIADDSQTTQGSDTIVDIAGDGEPLTKQLAPSQRSSDAQTSEERGGNAAPFEYRDLRSGHMASAYVKNTEKSGDGEKAISRTSLTLDDQVIAVGSHKVSVPAKDGQNKPKSEKDVVQLASNPDSDEDLHAEGTKRPSSRGKEKKRQNAGKVTEDNTKESAARLLKEVGQNGPVAEALRSPKAVAALGLDANLPLTQLSTSHQKQDSNVSHRETGSDKKTKKRKSLRDSAEDIDQVPSPRKAGPIVEPSRPEQASTDVVGREKDPSTGDVNVAIVEGLDGNINVNDSQNVIRIEEDAEGGSVPFHSKERKRLRRKSEQMLNTPSTVDVHTKEFLTPQAKSDRKSKGTRHVSGDEANNLSANVDGRYLPLPTEIAGNVQLLRAFDKEARTLPPSRDAEVLRSDQNGAKTQKKRRKSRKELSDSEDQEPGRDIELEAGILKSSRRRHRLNADGDILYAQESTRREDIARSPNRDWDGDDSPEFGDCLTTRRNLNLEDTPAKRVKSRRRSGDDNHNVSEKGNTVVDQRNSKTGIPGESTRIQLDSGESDFQDIPPSQNKHLSRRPGQHDSSAEGLKKKKRSEEVYTDLSRGNHTTVRTGKEADGGSIDSRLDLDDDIQEISPSEMEPSTQMQEHFDSPAKRVKSRRRNEEEKSNRIVEERTAGEKRKHKARTADSGSVRAYVDSDDGPQVTPPSKKKQSTRNRAQKGGKRSKTKVEPDTRSEPEPEGICPHGCGKVYQKKTSTYFRHKKLCALAPPS